MEEEAWEEVAVQGWAGAGSAVSTAPRFGVVLVLPANRSSVVVVGAPPSQRLLSMRPRCPLWGGADCGLRPLCPGRSERWMLPLHPPLQRALEDLPSRSTESRAQAVRLALDHYQCLRQLRCLPRLHLWVHPGFGVKARSTSPTATPNSLGCCKTRWEGTAAR